MLETYCEDKEIIIFGAAYCKYCRKAKKLLEDNKHHSWKYIDIDEQKDIKLLEKIKELSGMKTIPIIYKKHGENYKLIGGFDDLSNL